VFEICAILESKSRRPPRKISASSWHARSRQKLVTPIWLRQQQDFSTILRVVLSRSSLDEVSFYHLCFLCAQRNITIWSFVDDIILDIPDGSSTLLPSLSP
jgi:hypothetical protein